MCRNSRGFHDLPGQSGLSYLPGTGQNLDETTRFADPGKQAGVEIGALHDYLLRAMSTLCLIGEQELYPTGRDLI
jgi:hypothetical protein